MRKWIREMLSNSASLQFKPGTNLVTEVLGDSQSSQADTGTGARGLVHLTVHQRHFRVVALNHERFFSFIRSLLFYAINK